MADATLTDKLIELEAQFSLALQNALTGERKFTLAPVTTETKSAGKKTVYGFSSLSPDMNEWFDDRREESQEGFDYEIKNRTFEKTISIDRDDLEDNEALGIYQSKIPAIGAAYDYNRDTLAIAALQSTTQLCFDGLPFFSASHFANPRKSENAFDNSRTTFALTYDNFNTLYEDMMSWRDLDGGIAGITPTHLVVPPQLRAQALSLVQRGLVSVPTGRAATNTTDVAIENINAGAVDVLILPRLANQATTWYLADLSKPIKPLIYQLRRAVSMVSMVNPTDPQVFSRKKFLYGIDCRHAVGYSYPQLMAKAVG